MKKMLIIIILLITVLFGENYYENGKIVELEKVSVSKSRDGMSTTFFKTANGLKLKTQNRIIIKFNKDSDILSIIKKYPVAIIDSSVSGFLLLETSSGEDIFAISRQLHNESDILIAHPDFTRERRKR